jgi:hypothetical protein
MLSVDGSTCRIIQGQMNAHLEGSGRGLIDLLIRLLPRGNEGNHDCSQSWRVMAERRSQRIQDTC